MVFGNLGIDPKINALLRMELLDLAKLLTRSGEVELDFALHAAYRANVNRLSVSRFWEDYDEQDRAIGMKSDVVLHAFGAYQHTDRAAVRKFLAEIAAAPLPQLARQCFAALEEWRLEQLCTTKRPGTKKWFKQRHEIKQSYMKNRLKIHTRLGEQADVRLVSFYVRLHGGELDDPLDEVTKQAVNEAVGRLSSASSLQSTEDTITWTANIVESLASGVTEDMKSRYFAIDADWGRETSPEVDSSEQTVDPVEQLPNRHPRMDQLEAAKAPSEHFSSWNAETPNPRGAEMFSENESSSIYVRVPQEHLASTDRSDAPGLADEPYTSPGGHVGGGKSEGENAALKRSEGEMTAAHKNEQEYGKLHANVKQVNVAPKAPKQAEIETYAAFSESIRADVKRIRRTILQTIEKQRTGDRTGLHSGRLGKKLTSIVTEEEPRLFYKKKLPERKLDAAFSLLVDCSASMYDKMEETKRGIALFHETLYHLQIHHEVVGFWEDVHGTVQSVYPNYFQTVIPFTHSLQLGVGANVMQLKAEQDNRDGYAIRVISKRLLQRIEKQKVLIVFSDGEPAAADYHEDGVIDTQEAVREARKRGIDVIGIFLADGDVKESDREMMRSIYGTWSIVVPHTSELPDHLSPLLRKLLLQRL